MRVRPVRRLWGRLEVPGDKSISHRAALFGAMAEGVTEIRGLLEAEDCQRTLAALEALGAEITRKGPGDYRVGGAGQRGFVEPSNVIDCGNSGTTARLLLGVLAAQPFWTMLTGDDSLRSRPMGRVAVPLARMGATLIGRADGTRLPMAIRGVRPLRAISYELPVASAQVKSALLLAGLYADGPISVTEPLPARDHTERMLKQFGAKLETRGRTIILSPGPLRARAVRVPGDVSSAAFFLVGGLLVRESRVELSGVGLNPTRTGVLEALDAMGAGARVERAADASADGEPIGMITVATRDLKGTTIAGELVPRLIDEIPALAVAGAVAEGQTEIRDAAELRVKESDRIAALARELGKLGAQISERADGLVIEGVRRLRGAVVSSGGDHRLAMALAVAGLVADGETVVEDTACVATSYPGFADAVNRLAGHVAITVES